jgi:hypothetical protein
MARQELPWYALAQPLHTHTHADALLGFVPKDPCESQGDCEQCRYNFGSGCGFCMTTYVSLPRFSSPFASWRATPSTTHPPPQILGLVFLSNRCLASSKKGSCPDWREKFSDPNACIEQCNLPSPSFWRARSF